MELERFSRPLSWPDDAADRVAMARRRLCVGPERDAQIARPLPTGPRRLVALWRDARPGVVGIGS